MLTLKMLIWPIWRVFGAWLWNFLSMSKISISQAMSPDSFQGTSQLCPIKLLYTLRRRFLVTSGEYCSRWKSKLAEC